MGSTTIKVSDIIRMNNEAKQQSRVPCKPKKQQGDFKLIFEQKCKEVKDGTGVLYSES